MSYNTNVEIRSRDANVDNTTYQGNLEDGPTLPPDEVEPPPELRASKKAPVKRGKDKA